MREFVSEAIEPMTGTFEAAAMARAEPGLPTGFRWRDHESRIVELLAVRKQSGPEIGRLHGERYLRRHCYVLRMADGSIWHVYFVRHTPQGASPRRRWFLYERQPLEGG
jgi:hypothetical protein